MTEPHQGTVDLIHTFEDACQWLERNGLVQLTTKEGTVFDASVDICQKGRHAGEQVIRFFEKEQEFARAYECCWGHYLNCNRTWIGMYSVALDDILYMGLM
jgi:hypothetical protein